MNRAEDKAARVGAIQLRASYKAYLVTLDDDALDNEDYTYKYESRFLGLDADTVGDRLVLIEAEKARRNVEGQHVF